MSRSLGVDSSQIWAAIPEKSVGGCGNRQEGEGSRGLYYRAHCLKPVIYSQYALFDPKYWQGNRKTMEAFSIFFFFIEVLPSQDIVIWKLTFIGNA